MRQAVRIYLGVDIASAAMRDVTRGVFEYARPTRNWDIRPWPLTGQVLSNVRDWAPHGIIVGGVSDDVLETVAGWRIPLVSLDAAHAHTGIPVLALDQVGVGRIAAEHLRARGYQHFAVHGGSIGDMPERSFAEAVANCGRYCHPGPRPRLPRRMLVERLAAWLRTLPRPVGVLVRGPEQGARLINACRAAHLMVPEDVGVLCAEDDPLLCEGVYPSLSGVAAPSLEIGREAAQRLDHLLSGVPGPDALLLFPPTGVRERQSTGMLICDDADVVEAVAFIDQHIAQGVTVEGVCRHVGLSGRALGARFQRARGHTVRDEIMASRLQRARALLADTDLSIPDIAGQSGFRYATHLATTFRAHFGLSPTSYRRMIRYGCAPS